MDKKQRSLLLYLESRLVDNCGRVDTAHMNKEDMERAQEWNKTGFIGFGRITSDDIGLVSIIDASAITADEPRSLPSGPGGGTMWVTFTDDAWKAAHQERRARSDRMLKKRNYQTTAEKRAE